MFTNRRRTRAKVLVWDGTGLCIYMKRLEQGRFACLWERSLERSVELALFLEGSRLAGRMSLSPTEYTPRGVALPTRI